MPADLFTFKEFTVNQSKCAMKVGTDAVLLGAWAELPLVETRHALFLLDIGTGTGVIALMIAQRSKMLIDAIEIDKEAYRQALENCNNSKWNDRIYLHHISFQKFVPDVTKKYDVIICNPPYFSNSLQAASETRTVARHTCNLTFEELADGTSSLLNSNGSFATILPLKESKSFISIAKRYGLYPRRITYVKTTRSKAAKRVLLQFCFIRCNSTETTLIIENEDHAYSNEYKELTQSFYLGF